MPRNPRLLAPVAALALAGGLAVAVPAAGSAAPIQDQGVALPPLWRTAPPWNPLWGGTPGYVLHTVTPRGEGVPYASGIIRLSDGQELGPFVHSDRTQDTGLVGSSYLVELSAPGSSAITEVQATDLATGAVTSTTVPAGDDVLRADERWTLVRVTSPSGYQLRLLRPDSDSVVAGPATTWNAKYVGGDAGTAYLQDSTDVYRVDIAANTVATLPRPADGWGRVVVGPTRLFSIRGTTDANGAPVQQISWWSRDGQQSGEAQVSTASDMYDLWLPYGDRLLFVPEDVQVAVGPVRPVDLAGNTLEAPLVTDATDAEALGDGRVALIRSDYPAGSVSIVGDNGAGPHRVTDLPKVPQVFRKLRLAGDVLRGYADGNTNSVETASDGTGSWTPAPVPYAESGGVTLTYVRSASPDAGGVYDVSWPGGNREVTDVGPLLGHGGELLAVTRSNDVDAPTEVQDAQSGDVVDLVPEADSVALDHRWVWSLTPAGELTGHDATGAEPDVHLSTGLATSGERLLDVRGRFALVSSGYRSYVVDTHEVVPTWQVPSGRVQLGDGFVAGVNVQRPTTGPRSVTLQVFDLTADHTEHDYPGLQGLYSDNDLSFSADDADTARVAYVDVYGQPWRVDLSWLGTAPTTAPDTMAPVLSSPPSQPSIVLSSVAKAFTWSWSYVDSGRRWSPASGLASYDVRWRPATGSSARASAWTEPAAWQGITRATVSRTLAPGTGGCVSARAHDVDGNVSDWSRPACTFVDGAAPVPVPMAAAPRVARQLGETVSLPFHATDDDAVASYDVGYRVAKAGQASYGSWRASDPSSPFTTDPRPGSDWCVRFRGHDFAGRVGVWSRPHCQSVPLRADAFSSHADSQLVVSRRALGGMYLQLHYPGATATLKNQGGRAVALCMLRGPGQGVADVYFGRKRLGRVRLGAATVRQAVVTLPLPARAVGTVRVVEVGSKPVRIDGLAMLR